MAWGWTKSRAFRFAHLAAIGFVVVQQWLGELCPLTAWESEFRLRAGTEGLGESFIQYWLDRLLYFSAPPWMFTALYTAFGALVIATFVFYPPGGKNPDEGCRTFLEETAECLGVRLTRPLQVLNRQPDRGQRVLDLVRHMASDFLPRGHPFGCRGAPLLLFE